ncbi:cytochrome b5 domain-containing protein [Candidatus Clostridium radicumherbarum]|uniref:Cytochrome b5 domain-containing protein n=1 Tax=Candidatus Clostridium radicumherbarum TaxID=3381662 RepID=A0ABW8TMR8_9CLOT
MKKIFVFGILSFMLIVSGCSNKKAEVQGTVNPNASTESSTNAVANSNTSVNKEFTLAELSKYDGQNGNPAYVAVDGVIYDVTNAKGWRNGQHVGGVTAGKDLSKEIEQSPHGKDVLQGLPVVGKLK